MYARDETVVRIFQREKGRENYSNS